jgi:hypothetical protein
VIALPIARAHGAQLLRLLRGFDAFGNHLAADGAGDRDDLGDQGRADGRVLHLEHKGLGRS